MPGSMMESFPALDEEAAKAAAEQMQKTEFFVKE
jgi:hypothetical protein